MKNLPPLYAFKKTPQTVRNSTLEMHESNDPLGLNAFKWRRILTHFNKSSIQLSKTFSKLFYTIPSKVLPHKNLTACNSCRLIPQDKNPGVRPIGIGEVLRQTIVKTITHCKKLDSKNSEKLPNSAQVRKEESNMLSTA